MGKNIGKNICKRKYIYVKVNIARNFLIMLNNLPQMHWKPASKRAIEKQQKQLVIQLVIKLLIKLQIFIIFKTI